MPTVFLSYSSKDKSFTQRLATMFKENGVNVWMDDTNLRVGDSLIHKLGSAINQTDYVVVILSQDSVKSAWVQKELTLAMQKEISEEKFKVVPILKETCDIPTFLRDKIYADFTSETSFDAQFSRLLHSLGVGNENLLAPYAESEVANNPTLKHPPQHCTDADFTSRLPMPSQELSDEIITKVLEQLPRGPAVDFHIIPNDIIDHFGDSLSELDSGQLIVGANRIRCIADPGLRARAITVAVAGNIQLIGRQQFWFDAFSSACQKGPRMIAALLYTAPRFVDLEPVVGDIKRIITTLKEWE